MVSRHLRCSTTPATSADSNVVLIGHAAACIDCWHEVVFRSCQCLGWPDMAEALVVSMQHPWWRPAWRLAHWMQRPIEGYKDDLGALQRCIPISISISINRNIHHRFISFSTHFVQSCFTALFKVPHPAIMQFSIITMLGLSALAIAAPAPVAQTEITSILAPRTDGQKICCASGSQTQCATSERQSSKPRMPVNNICLRDRREHGLSRR